MGKPTEAVTAGLAVKLARVQRGWTQEELARKLSMDRGRLSQIENGALVNIKLEEVGDFQRLLGVNPQLWLVAAGVQA